MTDPRLTHEEVERISKSMMSKLYASAAYIKLATEIAVEKAGLPAFDAGTIALKLTEVFEEDLPEAIEKEIAERIKASPQSVKPEIDEALEARAFDEGNMTALGQLHKAYAKYGPEFLEVRRTARKSAATYETIEKADKIVKADEHKNPFDPLTKFGSDGVRQNEIVKFIRFFGTKAAAKAAAKYGTDLAGRPLAHRA